MVAASPTFTGRAGVTQEVRAQSSHHIICTSGEFYGCLCYYLGAKK